MTAASQRNILTAHAPLLSKEGWRRLADGVVLLQLRLKQRHLARVLPNVRWRSLADGAVLLIFSICFLSQNISAQTTSDGPATESRLAHQLASGSTEEKRSALAEIRNIRTEQASRLAVPALRDTDEIVRSTAASSVVYLPQTEAAAALAPLLNDRAEFVRREAAYALGSVGSIDASAQLISLLQKEKIIEVKSAVVIALGQSGDPNAVGPLTKILSSKPNDDTEFLRRSAARSIGQIAQILRTGDRKVLTPQNFLPEKYKELGSTDPNNTAARFPAFTAAVSVLTQVLKNRKEADDTRREAAFALGAIGDASAVSILQVSRNSEDPYLAEISREALLKLQNPK